MLACGVNNAVAVAEENKVFTRDMVTVGNLERLPDSELTDAVKIAVG